MIYNGIAMTAAKGIYAKTIYIANSKLLNTNTPTLIEITIYLHSIISIFSCNNLICFI